MSIFADDIAIMFTISIQDVVIDGLQEGRKEYRNQYTI